MHNETGENVWKICLMLAYENLCFTHNIYFQYSPAFLAFFAGAKGNNLREFSLSSYVAFLLSRLSLHEKERKKVICCARYPNEHKTSGMVSQGGNV